MIWLSEMRAREVTDNRARANARGIRLALEVLCLSVTSQARISLSHIMPLQVQPAARMVMAGAEVQEHLWPPAHTVATI